MPETPRTTPAQTQGQAASLGDVSDPIDRESEALLRANLEQVRQRLALAAESPGRPLPTLIAVTKYVSSPVAHALHRLGCTDLAENRAEPFLAKARDLEAAGDTPTWHFIGHIQRNKARRVLERADVVHSVDSLRLAETIVRLTDELERTVDVFIQVNLTGESEKQGLAAEDAPQALSILAQGEHVRVLGLMAMGPLDARGTRTVDDVFRDAADLARALTEQSPAAFVDRRCRLSMGMTGDAESAIAHGSDFVRIGSALFAGLSTGLDTSHSALDRPLGGHGDRDGEQHA